MDKSNKTDKYFSDRLGNFEAGPPESSWDGIVRKLDNKRKKKVVLLVFRIAAGMAILVSTGLGYYLLNRTADAPQTRIIADNKVESEPAVTGTYGEKESFFNESDRTDRKDVPETTVPEIARNKEVIGSPNQQPSLKNNTSAYDENLPVENLSSVNDEQDISYFAQIDPVRVPYVASDSLGRDIDFRYLPSDSGPSAEEAARMLLAQYYGEEVTEEARQQRWSLGSEVAPLYSYRSVSSENTDLMSASSIEDFNDTENGILAYAGGIRIGFSTGRRLSIQSGIYYSRYGQEKNGVQPVATSSGESKNQFMAVSNSTGTITGVIDEKISKNYYSELDMISSIDIRSGVTNSSYQPVVSGDVENISLKQYFDYFEFPLIMKYKIIDRKIDFSFSGGLITNFLVGNSVNMINNGKSTRISKTDDINVVNYQGSLGMGLEYPIKSNFALTIEPRFRYYLNSIDNSSPSISVHPFSFGFFAGINYRF